MTDYYQRDKRTSLPEPVKRFRVKAWSEISAFAFQRPPDSAVLVLSNSAEDATDTIRRLKPDFEAYETGEAEALDENTCMLLQDFRDKYNTP